MANVLREIWMLYLQDFDLVFEKDTAPTDMFCQQHDDEMLATGTLAPPHRRLRWGSFRMKIDSELVQMGLEYWPGDERHPEFWMPWSPRHDVQKAPVLDSNLNRTAVRPSPTMTIEADVRHPFRSLAYCACARPSAPRR